MTHTYDRPSPILRRARLLALVVGGVWLCIGVLATAAPKNRKRGGEGSHGAWAAARATVRATGLAAYCADDALLRTCFSLSTQECEAQVGDAYDRSCDAYNQSSMESQWGDGSLDVTFLQGTMKEAHHTVNMELLGAGKLSKAKCPHGVNPTGKLSPSNASQQASGKPEKAWDARYGYTDENTACPTADRRPEGAQLLCPGNCGNESPVTVKNGVLAFDVGWTVGSNRDPKSPHQVVHVKLPITKPGKTMINPEDGKSMKPPAGLVDQVLPVKWTDAFKTGGNAGTDVEWFNRLRVFATFEKETGVDSHGYETGKGRLGTLEVFMVREDGELANEVGQGFCRTPLASENYKDREFHCFANGSPCGRYTYCCGHCSSDSWESDGVCR